jgi:small subunit ribosomal protein S2
LIFCGGITGGNMNLPEIKIEDLLESGVHFGHNVRRWNPKMKEYIYGVRNNIHIFDLRITVNLLNLALVKIHETTSKSGKILFVGTKKTM